MTRIDGKWPLGHQRFPNLAKAKVLDIIEAVLSGHPYLSMGHARSALERQLLKSVFESVDYAQLIELLPHELRGLGRFPKRVRWLLKFDDDGSIKFQEITVQDILEAFRQEGLEMLAGNFLEELGQILSIVSIPYLKELAEIEVATSSLSFE